MSKTTQKRARDADAIDLTEEASPEKKPARVKAEALVKSVGFEGEIAKEVAEALTQTLEDEASLKETRAKAEDGDGEAMWKLGVWHEYGANGLAQDVVQARAWYKRSAAAGDPRGIASFGDLYLEGIGGPQDNMRGFHYVKKAARLGSDFGAMWLGYSFFYGRFGAPRNYDRAYVWLKKVADGECEFKHLAEEHITEAALLVGLLEPFGG